MLCKPTKLWKYPLRLPNCHYFDQILLKKQPPDLHWLFQIEFNYGKKLLCPTDINISAQLIIYPSDFLVKVQESDLLISSELS